MDAKLSVLEPARLISGLAESKTNVATTLVAGAFPVLQILPPTWSYVETVLLGRQVPRTASGDIKIGVLYLRQLLREFGGNSRLALAAWYQGPAAVRERGVLPETKVFVANVLALRATV